MGVPVRFFTLGAVVGFLLTGCGKSAQRNTISGAVWGAIEEGVVITLGGPGPCTTTTVAGGTYSCTGLADGSYTVIPMAVGYTFRPTDAVVTVRGGETGKQDFVATALPGTLDMRFGTRGVASITLAYDQVWATSLALQLDGKIVIAGSASEGAEPTAFMLTRHRADGSLDPTFGTDGKVTTSFGTSAAAGAVAIQADGKIVAAGWTATRGMALVRYAADGSLDETFGTAGVVTTLIETGSDASAVVIQPDGKILVAGSYGPFDVQAPAIVLARYDANGTLDAAFGGGGIVTNTVGTRSRADAMVLQRDGKIVIGGASEDAIPAERSIILRYEANGTVDSSFGLGGIARLPTFVVNDGVARVADFDGVTALAIQADGKIVAAVTAGQSPTFGHSLSQWFALARTNPDGSPDTTFGDPGSPGTVSTAFGGAAHAAGVAIQPDGKIVTGGISDEPIIAPSPAAAFAVTRHNSDGSPDASFGQSGKVSTTVQYLYGGGFGLEADGKIVAAGSMPHDVVLVRYWP